MKHTPGPWTVQFPTSDDPELAIVGGGRVIADMFGVSGNQPDNARLIAAAPELLEIVKRYYNREDYTFYEKQENWFHARALLQRIEEGT